MEKGSASKSSVTKKSPNATSSPLYHAYLVAVKHFIINLIPGNIPVHLSHYPG
ncbi:hypothetical protein M8C21_021450 [Ambrosia artemisiifolia]|uniref:Uncharacterized protein n=1 Tax=Ambrosia artemisiifolia TaxID=4212 RepID=A0AAD5D3V2_AMBAR|nr:hypothetical protein M8C21_021450 [Ambrosia artemisiifolia]